MTGGGTAVPPQLCHPGALDLMDAPRNTTGGNHAMGTFISPTPHSLRKQSSGLGGERCNSYLFPMQSPHLLASCLQ